jgi:peroxiredoxin
MKRTSGWIMPAALGVVLVAVLVGALLLYNHFESKTTTALRGSGSSSTATATDTASSASPGDNAAASGGSTGLPPGLSDAAVAGVPDFTMTDSNDNPVELASFKGLPTIMNFWTTWCPSCREELDAFQKMYDRYGTRVNFVMLNMGGQGDTTASVQKFCADNGYTFPVYFDEGGDGATLFGVTGVPETVFLNAQGLSYGKVVGGMPQGMLAQGMALLTR